MIGLRWQWRIEALAAVGFALLGVAVWQAGSAVPPSFMDTGFGAGVVPQWLGAVLVVLSLLLLIEALGAARRHSPPGIDTSTEDTSTVDTPGVATLTAWDKFKPVAVVALLMAMFINADHHWVPFYLSVAIFLFAVIIALEGLGKRQLLIAAGVTAITTAVVWFVFSQLFLVIIQ